MNKRKQYKKHIRDGLNKLTVKELEEIFFYVSINIISRSMPFNEEILKNNYLRMRIIK